MEERLTRLEARLDDVTATLRRMEARLAALEEALPEAPLATADGTVATADEVVPLTRPDATRLLAHLGRCFLVLGGAFLIRAITESGALASGTGAALGLAYALVWLLLADRAGRRLDPVGGSFCGSVALLIAYPLLWEATFKFQVLAPAAAAAAITLLTAVALVVAWRTQLQVVAWAATLGALATALPMLVLTHLVVGFNVVLLAIGLATLWLAYGRRWHGIRWPAALAADIMVFQATVLASRPGGPLAPYHRLSVAAVVALALALVLVYLGSFTVRILSRRRNVTAFEALQSLAVLTIGLGGAWRVMTAAAWSPVPLGAAALLLAAGFYGVAFTFVERRDGRGLSFQFFASIALLLALGGSTLAFSWSWATALWCALALTAAMLAARHDRITLRAHAALYLVAAAVVSGLLAWSLDTLFALVATAWSPFAGPAAAALATAFVVYPLLASGHRPAPPRWFHRLPALGAGILGALGAAGLGTVAIAALFGRAPHALEPGVLAAVRSALLAGAVLLLAALGSRERFAELGWLVYPLLAGAGLKLLFEDLARGRAITVFPALACYGVALILAPRLLRRRHQTPS